MKHLAGVVLLLGLIVLCNGVATAAIHGPVWPAPGGTTWTSSGNVGNTGGMTFNYSNFDLTHVGELFWGPWGTTYPQVALDGNTRTLSWSGIDLTATQATWTGTSPFTWSRTGQTWQTTNVDTRFTISLTNAAAFVPGDAGNNTTGVPVVAKVNGGFSATLLAEAYFDDAWKPTNVVVDSVHTQGVPSIVNFSGGFYYTDKDEEVTPELSSASLLLIGMLPVGLAWWRRRKQ